MTKTNFICAIGKGLNIINTGDWKIYPPIIDKNRCKRCGLCLLYCPTNSVKINDDDFYIDLSFCKGCGVCINECPANAIYFEKEEK